MHRFQFVIRNQRLSSLWFKRLMFVFVILFGFHAALQAQENTTTQPTWWFGGAAAANFNFYSGTTQTLNPGLSTPSPFHKGFGLGAYLGAVVEYRPNPVWGGILQMGYDDRRGDFNDVPCPCGQNSTLDAEIAYFAIEPSLRYAPFSNGFYIFGGPQLGINWGSNTFVFTQDGGPTTKAEFDEMKSTVFTGQIGVGYDIELAASDNIHKVELSPFLSFHIPEAPRSTESWRVTTFRLGAAIKFGTGTAIAAVEIPVVEEREVQFTVRAPKAVPVKRRVRETFPLRNYVFFEEGSAELPNRYVLLSKDQAGSFKEEQLQEVQPISNTGRSDRQMTVYYNILNIIGDRMKRNPGTTILLSGASAKGPDHGKERAETIKKYLVDVFGIDGSRITTEGRDKPKIPSEQPGGTKELDLLRAGDSRVDIESTSPEMTIQVGGDSFSMLRPVQIIATVEDPLDSHVIFNVEGARDVLASWSLEITDEQGQVQRYGPYTRDQESISGNAILGDHAKGNYKVVMLGQTKGGKFVKKESSVQLVRRDEPVKESIRYSILFDFDKSKTVASYDKFLTEVVTPLIEDNSIVIIHGHTDIIGEDDYNDNLSHERALDAQRIIENAISKSGKHGITFETLWFGENLKYAPFDNSTSEGRFYNRTVIIDIVPE